MTDTVCIDYLPESVEKYARQHFAIVAIDVIRATTTIVTAVALGRRCFAVASLRGAYRLAQRLDHPLLIGEIGGDVPPHFDMNNSPAKLALRTDLDRPVIILSSSGTKLIHNARSCGAVYPACLRNYTVVASYVAARHAQVAVIGAGSSKGEFREEDQLCCAWVAAQLVKSGYKIGDKNTARVIERWESVLPTGLLVSKSVDYLKKTDQLGDLDFILSRIDDLDCVCTLRNHEIVTVCHEAENRKSQPCTVTTPQFLS
jgi:2-phosphosulfolactate phosphatase